MIKTYKCPIHGEFEVECSIGDKELKECPKIEQRGEPCICHMTVARVFKPTGYSFHCDGFAGRGFSVPSYKK